MKPKDTALSFRLPADLKADLQGLADAEQRSLAQYVTMVLQAHVADKKKKPSTATIIGGGRKS